MTASSISTQTGQNLSSSFPLSNLPSAATVQSGVESALNAALNRLMSGARGESFELERLKDSLFQYLGACPAKLNEHGVSWDDPKTIGEMLLQLGKWLQWASPSLDRIKSMDDERRETVYELGNKFRLLGLDYLKASDRNKEFSAMEVRRRIMLIEQRLGPS